MPPQFVWEKIKQTCCKFLSNLTGAEGRFDYIVSAKEKVIGIIDYAHTPDALLNVLATIKNLRQRTAKYYNCCWLWRRQ